MKSFRTSVRLKASSSAISSSVLPALPQFPLPRGCCSGRLSRLLSTAGRQAAAGRVAALPAEQTGVTSHSDQSRV